MLLAVPARGLEVSFKEDLAPLRYTGFLNTILLAATVRGIVERLQPNQQPFCGSYL
jgi:hypothetical protein